MAPASGSLPRNSGCAGESSVPSATSSSATLQGGELMTSMQRTRREFLTACGFLLAGSLTRGRDSPAAARLPPPDSVAGNLRPVLPALIPVIPHASDCTRSVADHRRPPQWNRYRQRSDL